jgi:hypothetical protein
LVSNLVHPLFIYEPLYGKVNLNCEEKVVTEIINLKAILNLPKGTEHFVSDLHGELVSNLVHPLFIYEPLYGKVNLKYDIKFTSLDLI